MSARLSSLDRWSLGYAVLVPVMVLVRWSGPTLTVLPIIGVHAVLAGCALTAPHARHRHGVARFLGEFYPLLGLIALYSSIGQLNLAAGISHDVRVQAWEEAVFGSQLSYEWIRAWPSAWLSRLLHVAYLSFYFILAAAPLGLWLSGCQAEARRTALVVVVTCYICYAVSLAYPVAGPRYTFAHAHNAATEVGPALLTQHLLNSAAAWGTAFPSLHVAAALVASVSAWQGWKMLGAPLILLAVLLSLATVYGQLHYALDAVAGGVVALVVLLLHPPPPSSGGRCRDARPTSSR